ncbi:MAG TPA: hypothetical protein VGK47_06795 [Nitrososphaeraceae archaeon]
MSTKPEISTKGMRVGVKYWNEKGEAFYVTKLDKNGTLHSSSKPTNKRPFSLNRAQEIQHIVESEFNHKCIKIYE